MTFKLQTQQHLEFLSLKRTAAQARPIPTLFKMLHCWKSHVVAHLSIATDHILEDVQCNRGAQCWILDRGVVGSSLTGK